MGCIDFKRPENPMDTRILTSTTDVELRSAPIEPGWIIEGNPIARNATLSRSEDGAASTIVWECSEGKFNWYYDIDETIHILEGSVLLESDTMRPTRFGPGDVVFFKKGAHARWHVEGRVRKLAFCRATTPKLVGLALRVLNKLQRMVAPPTQVSGSLLDAR
jgi:uncharacterized cupin superfamily protein